MAKKSTPKSINREINLKTINRDPFYGLARAYTLTYATCYLVSPIFGLRLSPIQFIMSTAILVGIGLGLLLTLYKRNRYIVAFFAVAEALGCVAHFLKAVPWVPTFSDTAYIVMSVLDLIQSVLLFKLLDDL